MKLKGSYLFTIFFIGLTIWFVKHETAELEQVAPILRSASWFWIGIGVTLNIIYVFIHGKMYQAAFAAVSSAISVGDGMLLYLKRNFISVFLPAGGVSSLAFFSGDIQRKGVANSQINFASSIYGFVGILSALLIAVPVFIYGLVKGTIGYGEWFGLIAAALLLQGILLIYFQAAYHMLHPQ